MGSSTAEHSGRAKHGVTSEYSGGSDHFSAAKRVWDGKGEAELLLRRTVVHRKAPSTVKNEEEQGAVGMEGKADGGHNASPLIVMVVDLTDPDKVQSAVESM